MMHFVAFCNTASPAHWFPGGSSTVCEDQAAEPHKTFVAYQILVSSYLRSLSPPNTNELPLLGDIYKLLIQTEITFVIFIFSYIANVCNQETRSNVCFSKWLY